MVFARRAAGSFRVAWRLHISTAVPHVRAMCPNEAMLGCHMRLLRVAHTYVCGAHHRIGPSFLRYFCVAKRAKEPVSYRVCRYAKCPAMSPLSLGTSKWLYGVIALALSR